jgi:hypothetical protein
MARNQPQFDVIAATGLRSLLNTLFTQSSSSWA